VSAIAPYRTGLLNVGDDQVIAWECCGNPDGAPLLVVHGGPGSGRNVQARAWPDLGRHQAVLFDQRGCGLSRPHASDPNTALSANTTDHPIRDMELLRNSLGIERWMMTGGSWGSTLILAYAQRHADHVAGIVITGVTTTGRHEIEWLYRGARRLFPAAHERFVSHVPEASSELFGDGGILDAYARRASSPDPVTRMAATQEWCRWEDTLIAHENHGRPGTYSGRPAVAQMAFVRISAHFFSHSAWLAEDQLLREAYRLTGIPAVLIHGRLDVASPFETARRLAEAWSGAELLVLDDSGHTDSTGIEHARRHALSTVFDRATWT
jgi:proline iminopeptidase